MAADREQSRLHGPTAPLPHRLPKWLSAALTTLAGALVLIAALMFSVFILAVLIATVLVVGGYVWWRVRALRAQIHVQQRGSIIEGEIVRKRNDPASSDRTAPPPSL